MKRLRIYVDTSVIGGCLDPEFKEWSVALWDDFRLARYIPVVSDVTAAEVNPAPASVRELYAELLTFSAESMWSLKKRWPWPPAMRREVC